MCMFMRVFMCVCWWQLLVEHFHELALASGKPLVEGSSYPQGIPYGGNAYKDEATKEMLTKQQRHQSVLARSASRQV